VAVAIHQIVDTLAPGSAVSNCVLAAQEILQMAGFVSGIYASVWEKGISRQRLPRQRAGRALWLYHFSVGSPLTAWAEKRANPDELVLWYHNLTPPGYFAATDPLLASRLISGHEEVRRLADRTCGAIADSAFNAAELAELGYRDVQIVPPVFLQASYRVPPPPSLLSPYEEGGPNWLFVGRLVPNKAQTEVIAAFHAYKRLAPEARLFLVGEEGASRAYRRWLENQIAFLGLQADVALVGQVSQAELNGYYQLADCFVSMSEHEGFGVPLVEAMYFDVPVIAYDATAVAETLGGAGVLLRDRDPYLVAEVTDLVLRDETLRQAIIARQRRRLADFAYEKVSAQLLAAVRHMLQKTA